MPSFFARALLTEKVKLKPGQLRADMAPALLQHLRGRFEGKCSQHGYVRAGSVALHQYGMGAVQALTLNGDVVFEVAFHADVFCPALNATLPCTVVNMNKFGLLAQLTDDAGGPAGPAVVVLEAVVARKMVNVAHEVQDFDAIQRGDTVHVQIIGRKFQLDDPKISVVGRLVLGQAAAAADQEDGDAEDDDEEEDAEDGENDDGADEEDDEEDGGDADDEEEGEEDGEEDGAAAAGGGDNEDDVEAEDDDEDDDGAGDAEDEGDGDDDEDEDGDGDDDAAGMDD